MRPYKGVETLLPAVAGCHEIELVLVGDGDHLNHYRLLAGDLGATNVQFLGRVGDEELLEVYDRSDVIVLPSLTRAEAFGLVALEGMAAGCVPVVSDLPGVRDLVSRTGVVVPPGDVARLRAALLELAHSRPRLEQLSRAARRRAEGLGWDACVTRYEQALLAAVGAWQDGRATPAPPPDERDAPPGAPGRPVPHQAAGPPPGASRRAPGARPQPSPSMNGQVRSRGRSG
jgi:glycosyltransferase involved in cell wall biosynthesis